MDPYTPRTHPGGREKILGLMSTKEYPKITSTIASVQRFRQPQDDLDRPHLHASREGHWKSHNESSFIAETSFVRAPLNSRVVSNTNIPKATGKAKEESLDRVPLEVQEAMILEDLLYVLIGIEGTYVKYHPEYSAEDVDPLQGICFVVSPSLDSSLRDLVERILPLGTYYTAIFTFVEHRNHLDYGLVNHALCAAIRDMLKDYQRLLCQLEYAFNTSQFSLQKLWFYLHPTIHTLFIIYQLILELATADGPFAELSSCSSSSSDDKDEARDEALGLGDPKLKVVLSEIDKEDMGVTGGNQISIIGGEVLAIIYERMQNMSGDLTANMIYGTLLKAAEKPYVTMLRVWVMTGRLVDPYEELLVKENKFINRGIMEMDHTDEYWEMQYTLRDGSTSSASSSKYHEAGVPVARSIGGRLPGGACVPPLIEDWKHKILLAGKYLNVIRECGIEVPAGDDGNEEEEELSMGDEKFYKYIDRAYAHANRALLNLLLHKNELLPCLRLLKHYFFLSNSFFLTHFLDIGKTELRKGRTQVSLVKLQSLLELVLAGEGGVGDGEKGGVWSGFKENIKVTMSANGVYEWLLDVVSIRGASDDNATASQLPLEGSQKVKDDEKKPLSAMDALTFDIHLPFPLCIILSRKSILRYQLLFRFHLHLHHTSNALSSMWLDQKSIARRLASQHNKELGEWHKKACVLRARMGAWVREVREFAMEVQEANWKRFEGDIIAMSSVDAGGQSVEALLTGHVDYLDTCLKDCMLTTSKLLLAYSKLIVSCSTFALYSSSFTRTANQVLAGESPEGRQAMSKLWGVLGKFEKHFSHWFQNHLDCVQFYASSENVSLLPLVVRLNRVKDSS